ncbi:MAG: alpha/beta hydrolase [Desulfosalsimonadaceae bacterium]
MQIVADIPYVDDGIDKHRLYIYTPENAALAKVIFFVPGGAWRQGDKDQYAEMTTTLASYYGFVVVAINYRLSNDEDGAAVHPDHIEDVALAFQWVMENIGRYQGDPSAVVLFGQSAGAHLVALLATDEQYLNAVGYGVSNIRGVIAMSGVYELPDFVKYPANPLNLALDDILLYKGIFVNAFGSWDESVIGPASPARHVNYGQPPFLVIHTEYDMPGFVDDADHFYNVIHALNGPFAEINGLKKSDYSAETWDTATELAAAEPMLADYIGHYAEVVAINKKDREKIPTTWIVDFVNRE